jgi:hypothetical protein
MISRREWIMCDVKIEPMFHGQVQLGPPGGSQESVRPADGPGLEVLDGHLGWDDRRYLREYGGGE